MKCLRVRPRIASTIFSASLLLAAALESEAQTRKVQVAVPGYTIAVLSFLAAKANGYYAAEGLDVELIAMRASTANLALIAGNVVFSGVPLAGLTTSLRGGGLKLIFCQFDKPQHLLYARQEFPSIKALRGRKVAVSSFGSIDDVLLRETLAGNGVVETAANIDPGWIGTNAVDLFATATGRAVGVVNDADAAGLAETRFGALVGGAIDASVLIAPVSFYAKDQGYRELAAFQDLGFVLPSGGIVVRDETLKNDSAMTERFVRATMMGFLFMRDNRAGTIKVMTKVLRIDEATAAKLYDSSRPTLTSDGTVTGDSEKKMTAMVAKIAGAKEMPSSERLYDFALVKKAHAALQAKGWQP